MTNERMDRDRFSLFAVMAVPHSMEHIPLDAVEFIANHLSVKDLLSCCAVSVKWHQIFSNDLFWKKHCKKNIGDYLENTECQVQPCFIAPLTDSSGLPTPTGYKLEYIREQHLLRNWKTGSYNKEELEFDCDNSISYNIKVEFFANDYVLLHTTFQTEVWSVSQKPCLLMTIPFLLKEMWESNVYKAVAEKLVVVQCNVVQVFDISIVTNEWSFVFAFFLEQTEQFSSKLTEQSNIDDIFQETSYSIAEDLVRILCGDLLVGIVTAGDALNSPVMHIWNVTTGEKMKAQACPNYSKCSYTDVDIKVSDTSTQYILVVFEMKESSGRHFCSLIYDLEKFEFLEFRHFHIGDSYLFNQYLCILDDGCISLFKYKNSTSTNLEDNSPECCVKMLIPGGPTTSLRFIFNKIVSASERDVVILEEGDMPVSIANSSPRPNNLICFHYSISNIEIVNERFMVVHDEMCNARGIWELDNRYEKVITLPPEFGTYRAQNKACTKLVLERANKLIIFNFW